MSARNTRAPACASSNAVALPMPEAAPVTTAVLPFRFMFTPQLTRSRWRGAVEQSLYPLAGPCLAVEAARSFELFGAAIATGIAGRCDAALAGRQRARGQLRELARLAGRVRRDLAAGDRPLHEAQRLSGPAVDDLAAEDDA